MQKNQFFACTPSGSARLLIAEKLTVYQEWCLELSTVQKIFLFFLWAEGLEVKPLPRTSLAS